MGKRIQGWQNKPLSHAGKTILIRNVAQEIPAYTMSCFMLPKTLCQEIETMFNKFWWQSSAGGGRGLNWLSWSNMCMAKTRGGLGFKSLHGFNIALLGKHIWNFTSNPQSLVSRVFKAKYFPNTHILRAKKGQNPSFIWQGILTAMETLRTGYRWVVGNGRNIQATTNQWIRSKKDFKVENSHVYEGRAEPVSTYILPNSKQWNVPMVNDCFVVEDAQAI